MSRINLVMLKSGIVSSVFDCVTFIKGFFVSDSRRGRRRSRQGWKKDIRDCEGGEIFYLNVIT